MRQSRPTRQAQFRLPEWATELIEQVAEERRISKTQVVLNALECLRERELEELMAEGYEPLPGDTALLGGAGGEEDEHTRPAW